MAVLISDFELIDRSRYMAYWIQDGGRHVNCKNACEICCWMLNDVFYDDQIWVKYLKSEI